jgi:hypothetical protein
MSYVNLDILTPIDVNCDNFEVLFHSKIKTCVITKKETIDSIVFALKTLKIDTTNTVPDVRVKITIDSLKNTNVYCLSKMGVIHENISYIPSDTLIEIIKKQMK